MYPSLWGGGGWKVIMQIQSAGCLNICRSRGQHEDIRSTIPPHTIRPRSIRPRTIRQFSQQRSFWEVRPRTPVLFASVPCTRVINTYIQLICGLFLTCKNINIFLQSTIYKSRKGNYIGVEVNKKIVLLTCATSFHRQGHECLSILATCLSLNEDI